MNQCPCGRTYENNKSFSNHFRYGALHDWVKSKIKKPSRCETCRQIKKLDLANVSEKYKRYLTDWKWL